MKAFYVDLMRGKRVALLAGPFRAGPPDQPDAVARKYERAAVAKANEVDPWSHFDPYGVVAVDSDKLPPGAKFPPGKLNHLIEIDAADLLVAPEEPDPHQRRRTH